MGHSCLMPLWKVLRGCDVLLEGFTRSSGRSWSQTGRALHTLASQGPALAGRFICYDSGFTREDRLLDETDAEAEKPHANSTAGATPVKIAGHAEDGLASMRTHTTPVKSAGHAGDGLASMRTHTTPVKSAGHAGDGLASMRTHTTPVKSAGHAGDGLASMRTQLSISATRCTRDHWSHPSLSLFCDMLAIFWLHVPMTNHKKPAACTIKIFGLHRKMFTRILICKSRPEIA